MERPAADENGNEYEYREEPGWKGIGFCIFLVGFVIASSTWGLWGDDDVQIGWLLLGLGMIVPVVPIVDVIIKRLRWSGPLLRLDDRGFVVFTTGRIPWTNVSEVALLTSGKNDLLGFILVSPWEVRAGVLVRGLMRVNKWWSGADVTFLADGLDLVKVKRVLNQAGKTLIDRRQPP